ncbi:hypothetical protein EMIHUDRAFT_63514, partial [Emiliania huxleyi CCMP1516]|uniref:Protein kinase domain-containing protein n=2 Tax=Emiliania huxleyi TaxID=2903 RepID=A0A0D3K8P8_EMIH1
MLLLASTAAHSSFVAQSAHLTQHHRVASAPSCTAVLDAPYREAEYDPEAADRYFRARPLVALRRAAEIAFLSAGFVGKVLADKQLGREEAMVDRRSEELLQLVTRLGVTAIKVGQVLSIRPDLLPAPYAKGLEKLQDSVQPFPAALGREIIERELSIRIEDVFSAFSAEPVAAASIGQVYRGTLRASGEEVAIKVQRPSVLQDVALDLFMLRFFAPAYQEANDVNTDVVGLVDAWGTGFVNELDYTMEAAATAEFAEAMAARGLGSVTSPEVVPSLSSTHVLTTKWVEGERLASSNADDVPRLCGVALNAYLTMLLDTGVLHCDPHPGNLLRTTDGRLCILDWGMTQRVPSDLQLSLLEFIANLNAEQYDRVPDDLVNLRFVPADKIGELRASGLTVAISKMLRLAAKGGGPAGAMRRMLQSENADVFAIPDYFVYMSRAFSTLEGIGLSSDSNYAILKECFPYLAKRLLSDDSPRARGALRTLLYGGG